MQVSSTNNLSFTSVVPYRLYLNGELCQNSMLLQQSGKELVKLMAKPVKENSKFAEFFKELAKRDPDFNFERAVHGYSGKRYTPDGDVFVESPSNYFSVMNLGSHFFITTGQETDIVRVAGREIGRLKHIANSPSTSGANRETILNQVKQAQKNYGYTIKRLFDEIPRRIKTGFNPQTREKVGNCSSIVIEAHADSFNKFPPKLKIDDLSFMTI